MLHGAALRSLLRGPRASLLVPRLTRPASALYAPRSARLGALAKNLQSQTFASLPSRDDEPASSGKSKKQQIQELLEENAALKKEVETLKAEVAKKPNKFMGTLQQYGLPFLAWWTSLYLASGVSIYVALDTGLVSGASIIDFIMQLGLDKFIDPTRLDPTYGNIAIAVIVNEAVEVIRFPFTLATLPYIKRVFSRTKAEETK
ncbi:unnamed protein product [Phytophthora fragariaefolia]|uniref:Unnamed protein product n=1 Tax=Phytophthora fragariaefolia TaxID=1490495 RepID=A0A9W6XWJ2_9STRA|nr:unnamed protein product [Phytophthora fragariaefolia]